MISWVKVIWDSLIFDEFTIIVFGTLELLLQLDIIRIYDS